MTSLQLARWLRSNDKGGQDFRRAEDFAMMAVRVIHEEEVLEDGELLETTDAYRKDAEGHITLQTVYAAPSKCGRCSKCGAKCMEHEGTATTAVCAHKVGYMQVHQWTTWAMRPQL